MSISQLLDRFKFIASTFFKELQKDVPVYVRFWGEKTFHEIRDIDQKYDKDNKPFIEILVHDDIVMEDDGN